MNPIKWIKNKLFARSVKKCFKQFDEKFTVYQELTEADEVTSDHVYSINMKEFFYELANNKIDYRNSVIKCISYNKDTFPNFPEELYNKLGSFKVYLVEINDLSVVLIDSEKLNGLLGYAI